MEIHLSASNKIPYLLRKEANIEILGEKKKKKIIFLSEYEDILLIEEISDHFLNFSTNNHKLKNEIVGDLISLIVKMENSAHEKNQTCLNCFNKTGLNNLKAIYSIVSEKKK
jgi:hypothetical protein